MIYQHSYLRSKTFPSISVALQAILLSELPGPDRDTRQLNAITSRIAVASPRLAGNILTRKTAISSFDWKISSDNKEEDTSAIERRLRRTIEGILSGVVNEQLFGAFALRLSWDLTETPTGKSWRPRVAYSYDPTELQKEGVELLILEGTDVGRPQKRNAREIPDLIFGTDSTYWTGGLLRSIVFHEILRNENLQEWANFNKKLKGLIQGKADEGSMKDAGNALKSMLSNNYSVTGKDVEFVFNEMTSNKGTDSFKFFKEALEGDSSIAILGQANTAQLPNNGGSRAGLQVLNLIRADILFSDMKRATEIVNDQLLLEDYRRNVKRDATETPYEFSFVFDDVKDTEANARTIEIASRIGVKMKEEEVYDRLGLTAPGPDDKILEISSSSTGIPGL